jgi:hypothetical protein
VPRVTVHADRMACEDRFCGANRSPDDDCNPQEIHTYIHVYFYIYFFINLVTYVAYATRTICIWQVFN